MTNADVVIKYDIKNNSEVNNDQRRDYGVCKEMPLFG